MSNIKTPEDAIEFMREHGIKAANFSPGFLVRTRHIDEDGSFITRIELSDTIPAPPPVDWVDSDGNGGEVAFAESLKDPSLCQGVGCALPGGWHATPYCRAHGLSAAGVRT